MDGTFATGISGNDIVGYYFDASDTAHGFLFDGSTWTTLDDPSGEQTYPSGISGNTVVGYYLDPSTGIHGFEATVPEPSTLALSAAGAAASIGYRWRRKRTMAQPRTAPLA